MFHINVYIRENSEFLTDGMWVEVRGGGKISRVNAFDG